MIFHVTLEHAEDGWVVAECPALPGCVSQAEMKRKHLKTSKKPSQPGFWAEDQKAVSGLKSKKNQRPIVVAV